VAAYPLEGKEDLVGAGVDGHRVGVGGQMGLGKFVDARAGGVEHSHDAALGGDIEPAESGVVRQDVGTSAHGEDRLLVALAAELLRA